ncbi:Uncharacterised protein [Mycobacteroides abscessus subsp. abscessus]|nr:Uncharacterised protein [Mycobacteroides abscessus subsp. abscessus]
MTTTNNPDADATSWPVASSRNSVRTSSFRPVLDTSSALTS